MEKRNKERSLGERCIEYQLLLSIRTMYVEPSIQPDDSCFGENPNRLQCHTQLCSVILKPYLGNSQDLFIRRLSALALRYLLCHALVELFYIMLVCITGIDVSGHDIGFAEDNWVSPVVLDAWGLGWEIWMDGMEITQFTYFQQNFISYFFLLSLLRPPSSLFLSSWKSSVVTISVETTYGLERILIASVFNLLKLLKGVDHFKKIQYADGITYGELFFENEQILLPFSFQDNMSAYYFEHASVCQIQKHFELFRVRSSLLSCLRTGNSCIRLIMYDQLLKTSQAFNILDSRGFVGNRACSLFQLHVQVSLTRQCAQLWLETQESLGHPLGFVPKSVEHVCPKEVLEAAVKKPSTQDVLDCHHL
ncbi:Glycine-tRNA ligase, partial [Theobroma cacao]